MESLDRLFDVFSMQRRRFALYALDQAEEPIEIDELAAQIQRWEADEVDPGDDFEDVKLSLIHSHLPKAAQAEYIEYDRETGEIQITGEPVEFKIVLAVSEVVEAADPGSVFDPDQTTPEAFLSEYLVESIDDD